MRASRNILALCPHSYSLEGLSGSQEEARRPAGQGPRILEPSRMLQHDMDERGSLVSLTEEQEETGPPCGLEKQVGVHKRTRVCHICHFTFYPSHPRLFCHHRG